MRKKMYTIPKICRTGDDGAIISYLGSDGVGPNLGLVETLIRTLRMAWLPFGLHYSRASKERVRDAAIWAIAELKGQIALIEDKFGIAPQMQMAYSIPTGVTTSVPTTTEDKEEEEDEEKIEENLEIDLGDEFDLTQNLLTQLS